MVTIDFFFFFFLSSQFMLHSRWVLSLEVFLFVYYQYFFLLTHVSICLASCSVCEGGVVKSYCLLLLETL